MAKRNRIPIQALVNIITLSVNIPKNGVEIRFPGDPGEEVRGILTENGWRFNPYGAGEVKWQDPTWYKRMTPEVLAFARNLVQLLDGVDHTAATLAALTAPAIPTPPAPQPQLEAARMLTQSRSAVLPTLAPAVPAQLQVEPAPAPVAAKSQPAAPQPATDPLDGTVEIKVPSLAA